ncbi:hypothetical protein RB619_18945 [Flavobacterium sp. LHD-80]|uniref:hypothetical protein n=1 Tax=Flavobacterium sp. LHD-80 TaxID=3071411 RepID=UPI0027E07409|nr:hypothetical protein [Flavobacterium sp. LHD-80]MDQ6472722.1 hypothetical protein [Flavobacterium sp. LHD-80]
MKQLLDLDSFTKALCDKGYDGYFTTQAAYPGKLKDSISEYLEACAKGAEPLKTELFLMGYLEWSGDDKPSVECMLWVKHEKGNFELQKMDIVRKDQFGLPLKHCSLRDLSSESLPKASEAIALVKEAAAQKTIQSARRFKF